MEILKKFNKITKIHSVYESKFLNVYEVYYINKKNKECKWIVASRNKYDEYKKNLLNKENTSSDAVIIVGKDEKNRLLMIREFRVPVNDYVYSLPAGLIDSGEDIYKSAERELKEETGLELYDINYDESCKFAFASVGMSDESLSIVYGKVRGRISTDLQEDSEIIQPFFVDQKLARDLLGGSDKIDVKAWLVLKDYISIEK